jgi:hypothetical protein
MKYKNTLSHDVMIEGPSSVITISSGEVVDLPPSFKVGSVLTLVPSPKPTPKTRATAANKATTTYKTKE